MKALRVLPILVYLVVCLVAVGCNEDPARSVKIIARPPQPAKVVASAAPSQPAPLVPRAPKRTATPHTPPPSLLSGWLQDFCPIPAEDSSGPSRMVVKGPCEFQHQGAASCQAIGDDFLVAVTRKAKQGTLVAFVNVEHYHGPGSYEGSQIFMAVQSGTTIHRWSSDEVNTTVGPGEAFLDLPATRLTLEPTLKDCSILIGPATGYQYQCGGLDFTKPAIEKADEVVSGKLQCAGKE